MDVDVMAGLREIKERDGIPISEQVHRALRQWLEAKGIKAKTDRKRASTRKRP